MANFKHDHPSQLVELSLHKSHKQDTTTIFGNRQMNGGHFPVRSRDPRSGLDPNDARDDRDTLIALRLSHAELEGSVELKKQNCSVEQMPLIIVS